MRFGARRTSFLVAVTSAVVFAIACGGDQHGEETSSTNEALSLEAGAREAAGSGTPSSALPSAFQRKCAVQAGGDVDASATPAGSLALAPDGATNAAGAGNPFLSGVGPTHDVVPAPEGTHLVASSGGGFRAAWDTAQTSPATVDFPSTADGSTHLVDAHTGVDVQIQLVGAGRTPAASVGGYVLYRGAGKHGEHLLQRVTEGGAEEYLALATAPGESIDYDVSLGASVAGLRLVSNTLEFLDAKGAPRLRMAPPSVVGADCQTHDVAVTVTGCAVDTSTVPPWGRAVTPPGAHACRVSLTLDASVTYPAVLDPLWSTTGGQGTARYYVNAVRLSSGDVLVAGGQTASGPVATTEIYNVGTGSWAAAGSFASPHVARYWTVATLLSDGRVLVAGGYTSSNVASKQTDIYSAGTWSVGPDLQSARGTFTATLLGDNTVLIAGGDSANGGTYYASSEIYTPGTPGSTALTTASMPNARSNHTATLLTNGKVLVTGGYNSSTGWLNTAALYDPAASAGSRWSSAHTFTTARYAHSAVRLSDGKVLIAGGADGSTYKNDAQTYDPSADSWTSAGVLSSGRFLQRAVLLPNGTANAYAVLTGGYNGGSLNNTDFYDPSASSSTWWAGPTMNAARHAHTSVLLANNKLLVTGGANSSGNPVTTTELLDLCPAMCDDGNPCTTDACTQNGCTHANVANGTSCATNVCFSNMQCTAGVCGGGSAVPTDDGNTCTTDGCLNPTGVYHQPNPGQACATDLCKTGQTCDLTGGCSGGTLISVDDGNPCTVDSCASPSGVITHAAKPVDTACSTSACLSNQKCDGIGNCAGGSALQYADTNPCTLDTCDPVTGPHHDAVADGTPCSDGNLCNGTETCSSGACTSVSGTDVETDDHNPCTTDSCSPTTGVHNVAIANCGVPLGAPPASGVTDATLGATAAALFSTTEPPTCENQCNVTAGAIDTSKASIVHGHVLLPTSADADFADVTIVGHPELGHAITRSDGWFDFVLPGGGTYVVHINKAPVPGHTYLPIERHVTTRWNQIVPLPESMLTERDSHSTVVSLQAGAAQVARGSVISDGEGSRQATLVFPSQETTIGWAPTGGTMTVRATEFTDGKGMKGMPGDLPPLSGYSYAVDFSIDEADPATVSQVKFAKPVTVFVDNFLNIPNGASVPAGYYDRALSAWVPEASGTVINIVSCNNNTVQIDVDGSAGADPGQTLVSSEEIAQLASTYCPVSRAGKSLWRVPISHFSWWDFNWGFIPGGSDPPPTSGPVAANGVDDPCMKHNASVIECENQTLGEDLPIAGTSLSLSYRSDRQRGRAPQLTIPISGPSAVPAAVKREEVTIEVEGRVYTLVSTTHLPNQNLVWGWDRIDAFGREVHGSREAKVVVAWVYGAAAADTPAFNSPPTGPLNGTMNRSAREYRAERTYQVALGGMDALDLGFGGWMVSDVPALEPTTQTLYLGDGSRRTTGSLPARIDSVAGNGNQIPNTLAEYGDGQNALAAPLNPYDVVAGADGSLFVSDMSTNVVRKIDPSGILSTVGGTWTPGSVPPSTCPTISTNTSATSIFMKPWGLARGPDGSIYVAENNYNRVVRILPDANHTAVVVAGNCTAGFGGDDNSAPSAMLNHPRGVAVAPDGTVYIADSGNRRVRRVSPDGVIKTVAGGCSTGCGTIGATPAPLATAVTLYAGTSASFENVSLGSDGSIFLTFSAVAPSGQVLRIAPDGSIAGVAGAVGAAGGYSGEGGPATSAAIQPLDARLGPDGAMYISDNIHSRVERIDGTGRIATIVGPGVSTGPNGDGGPAAAAYLNQQTRIAFGPDGSLYIADRTRLRKVSVGRGLNNGSGYDVADGSRVLEFDVGGRATSIRTRTHGATLEQFHYDALGRLDYIDMPDSSNRTTFAYPDSVTVQVTSPFQQQTTLTLDATTHYLTQVKNPANETTQLVHDATGLLTQLTDAKNYVHNYVYDPAGLLKTDTDATPGSPGMQLTRVQGSTSWVSTLRTPEGRVRTITVDDTPDTSTNSPVRVERRTVVSASGLTSTDDRYSDGRRVVTLPDETVTTTYAADPRFGMGGKYAASVATASGGHQLTRTETVSVVYPSGSTDPFAITSETRVVALNGTTWLTSTFDRSGTAPKVTTSTLGRTSEVTLDSLDRPVNVHVQGLTDIATNYDSVGRVHQVTQGARTFTINYNATNGFIDSIVDGALNHTTQYTSYDSVGRVKTMVLPGSRTVQLNYDANGNLNSLTPPGATAHGMTSNEADLLSTYTPPDAGQTPKDTSYLYDYDRLLTTATTPSAAVVSKYDAGGRLLSTVWPQDSVTRSYDPATGHLMKLVTGTGTILDYAYTGKFLEHAAVSGPFSHTVDWTHNNYFQELTRTIDGANSVTYGYDGNLVLSSAGSMTITRDTLYNKNGLLTGTTMGLVSDAYTYDTYGAVTDYQAKNNSTQANLYTLHYDRDAGGRVHKKTETIQAETAHTWRYEYDSAGRLYQVYFDKADTATVPNYATGDAQYEYDANGNLTTVDGSVVGVYDAQDRVTSFSGATFLYSNNGELLSKTVSSQSTAYAYDVMGNLRGFTPPSPASAWTYLLDGLNRRVGAKQAGTLQQGFVYGQGNQIVSELDGSGNLVSTFVYGTKSHVPDWMTKGGSTYRLITDQLGSVRLVVKTSDASVVQRLEYDAWGVTTDVTGTGLTPGFQPFGFAGGLYDRQTKFVRFGARDYDPSVGRWVSKDGLRFNGGDTNLYAYCHDDPVNRIDPSGHLDDPTGAFAAALAAAEAAGTIGATGTGVVGGGGALGAAGGVGAVGLVGAGFGAFYFDAFNPLPPTDEGPGEGGAGAQVCHVPDESGVFETCTLIYEDESTCNYLCHSNDELITVPKAIPISPSVPGHSCADNIPVRRE